MKLTVLGSSSAGNCYLLTASTGETLIIEAGIDMKDVKKALDWNLRNVVGCVISHEHRDHSKHLKEMLSSGIRCLALEEVFASHCLKNRAFCKTVEPYHGYIVGSFRIFTLEVVHDVKCIGFVIEHSEMGRLLFITDTMQLDFELPKRLNHVLIEANYADDILNDNIKTGLVPAAMKERLMRSHMELETTKSVLRSSDLSDTVEIVLLHLSSQNSDAERFKREAERVTGLPVFIARHNLKLELSQSLY